MTDLTTEAIIPRGFLLMGDPALPASPGQPYIYRLRGTLPVSCRRCGRPIRHKGYDAETTIDDVDNRVFKVRLGRGHCPACNAKVRTLSTDIDASSAITTRLAAHVIGLLRNHPAADVAKLVGRSPTWCRNFRQRLLRSFRNAYVPEAGAILCMDEHHARKQPHVVISDFATGAILAIERGKDERAAIKALLRLRGRDQVRYLVTDFWAPYAEAARTVLGPENVRLVYDRWHVQQQVIKAFTKSVNALHKRIKALKNTRPIRIALTEQRRLLLTPLSDLEAQDRANGTNHVSALHEVLDGYPAIRVPWELKEAFLTAYATARSPQGARGLFMNWLADAEQCPAYIKTANTIRAHLDGICLYFQVRATNGHAENNNRRIKGLLRSLRRQDDDGLADLALLRFGQWPTERVVACYLADVRDPPPEPIRWANVAAARMLRRRKRRPRFVDPRQYWLPLWGRGSVGGPTR